jgi:hypothetical protein
MPVKQRLAAYYRAAAARGRGLLTRATTPWVREQLGAEIAQCDRMVEEIEGAAEPTPTEPAAEDKPREAARPEVSGLRPRTVGKSRMCGR